VITAQYQEVEAKSKAQLLFIGLTIKKTFGVLMMLFGLSIIIGYDRYVESLLLELTPDAWLGFITRY
jgi:hypothetical protein